MTKKFVISMSFVLISGIALAACLPGATPTPTTNEQAAESLGQAMMTGEPLRCQIVNQEQTETIEFLTKDQKTRVTTLVTAPQTQTSNMINDGTYIYIWQEGQAMGYKMMVPSEENVEEMAATYEDTAPDFSQEDVRQQYEDSGYSITCIPATISDSEFMPPTDVNFQDTSAMMNNALEAAQRMDKPY